MTRYLLLSCTIRRFLLLGSLLVFTLGPVPQNGAAQAQGVGDTYDPITGLHGPPRGIGRLPGHASGYVFRYWKDKNKDGHHDSQDEFIGWTETTFQGNHPITLLISAKRMKGVRLQIKLADPKGRTCFSRSETADATKFRFWHKFSQASLLTEARGPGKYRAEFYAGGKLVDSKQFTVAPNEFFYVARTWRDRDEDGKADFPDELVGNGSRVFHEDEKLLLALKAYRCKGKTAVFKIMGTMADGDVLTEISEMAYENTTKWRSWDVDELLRILGPGRYVAAGYVGEKCVGKQEIELKDETSGTIYLN